MYINNVTSSRWKQNAVRKKTRDIKVSINKLKARYSILREMYIVNKNVFEENDIVLW